jgi:hypothetical protein
LLLGAVNATEIERAPVVVAVTLVGAEGAAAVAVTVFDAAVVGLLPDEFVAIIANVYEVPTVNPVIEMGDAPEPVIEPGVEVAVNEAAVPPVAAAV